MYRQILLALTALCSPLLGRAAFTGCQEYIEYPYEYCCQQVGSISDVDKSLKDALGNQLFQLNVGVNCKSSFCLRNFRCPISPHLCLLEILLSALSTGSGYPASLCSPGTCGSGYKDVCCGGDTVTNNVVRLQCYLCYLPDVERSDCEVQHLGINCGAVNNVND
jgi:hypothetical protein